MFHFVLIKLKVIVLRLFLYFLCLVMNIQKTIIIQSYFSALLIFLFLHILGYIVHLMWNIGHFSKVPPFLCLGIHTLPLGTCKVRSYEYFKQLQIIISLDQNVASIVCEEAKSWINVLCSAELASKQTF